MSIRIIWSPRAQKTYLGIGDFILAKWSYKEVKSFAEKTSSTILKIARTPEMFIASNKKNIRKGFISKHTCLYYRIKSDEIELVAFWDNRQNPNKLKL